MFISQIGGHLVEVMLFEWYQNEKRFQLEKVDVMEIYIYNIIIQKLQKCKRQPKKNVFAAQPSNGTEAKL